MLIFDTILFKEIKLILLRVGGGRVGLLGVHPLGVELAGPGLALLAAHAAGPGDGLAPQLGVQVAVPRARDKTKFGKQRIDQR